MGGGGDQVGKGEGSVAGLAELAVAGATLAAGAILTPTTVIGSSIVIRGRLRSAEHLVV